MRDIVWGTYRPAEEFNAVLEQMIAAGVFGVDTAPNYCAGESENKLGQQNVGGSTRIFTKVGYTSGDPKQLLSLSNGARYCASQEYVSARIELSHQTVLKPEDKFECVFIHNPEHILEHAASNSRFALERAFSGFKVAYDKGYFRTIGVATWSISPYSDCSLRLYDALERVGLSGILAYWMHPVNILRREVIIAALIEERERVPGDWRLLASAPFAGGDAFRFLGNRFASIFGGDDDPIYQALSLTRVVDALPVCGIGTVKHAEMLFQSWDRGMPCREQAVKFVKMVDEL